MKKKLYILILLLILSYSYVLQNMFFPGIILSFSCFLILFYYENNIKFNFIAMILITVIVMIFNYCHIEKYYDGLMISSIINTFNMIWINQMFNNKKWYENFILKVLIAYLTIFLLFLIGDNQYKLIHLIIISVMFLPLISSYYYNRVKILVYKDGIYDTVFNRQVH